MSKPKRKLINIKRSTKQYITVALICVITIGAVAVFTNIMTSAKIKNHYEGLLTSAKTELRENTKTVFKAISDIPAGDYLTDGSDGKDANVKKMSVYSSQPQESYIASDSIGKRTLIDIAKGTDIVKGMITADEIASDERESEFEAITINSNIISNNTVDVDIIYPNGELYVVLSKKIIKGIQPETATCYFWLNEEELLRISAAIVDAGLYQGAKLITAKYVDPSIQEASEVTYTPSVQVLSLIESDPNIVDRCTQKLNKTIRKSLENRLASTLKEDVTTKNWDVPDYQFNNTDDSASATNPDNDSSSYDFEQPTTTPTPTITPSQDEDLGSKDNKLDNAELGAAPRTDNYLYYAKAGDQYE